VELADPEAAPYESEHAAHVLNRDSALARLTAVHQLTHAPSSLHVLIYEGWRILPAVYREQESAPVGPDFVGCTALR